MNNRKANHYNSGWLSLLEKDHICTDPKKLDN